MLKRENLFSLLTGTPGVIPAAFFLHFDPTCHQGQAAINKHLEFFRYTGMDFVKIQYERTFPPLAEIQRPEDWRKMPLYGREFYAPQLEVVDGLVKAAGKEAVVMITLYSPFMCAGHTAGQARLTRHIEEDPQAVQQGMQIISDSLMIFVQECIALGVDGFYHSTQGGEVGRFSLPGFFESCVKPYDLFLMEEINKRCSFNILHICDYSGEYTDLSPFLDYPGQVVSSPLLAGGRRLAVQEVSQVFRRPVMGGLDRHGVLVNGSPAEIEAAVRTVLADAPERFILGADCTVPGDIGWDNLRLAIETAHHYRAG